MGKLLKGGRVERKKSMGKPQQPGVTQPRPAANSFHFRASRKPIKKFFGRLRYELVCNLFDDTGFLLDEVRVKCPTDSEKMGAQIHEIKTEMLQRKNFISKNWSTPMGI